CGSLLWFAESVLGPEIDAMDHDAILIGLHATDAKEAIHEMVDRLTVLRAVAPEHAKDVVRSLLHREELGSTGIGNGIAVPHAAHSSVKRLVGAMATSHKGVEFDSLDAQPVRTIFLFVSPMDRPNLHLPALSRIAQFAK
ncbi:PTS sugar transporter subunit IIA, partial [Planctomycetota bacterium]